MFFICCMRPTGGANSGASAIARVTLEEDSFRSSGGAFAIARVKLEDDSEASGRDACADARLQVRIKTGMKTKERIIC